MRLQPVLGIVLFAPAVLQSSAAPVLDPAEAAELERCARLLFLTRGGGDSEGALLDCRVPLLAALIRDELPDYRYNAIEDCHFWAHYGARDRTVEGSRLLDFNRLSALRLADPFDPPLQVNGTAFYVGAHRSGEDGVNLRRRYGLRLHLFEPSASFFAELREAVRPLGPGFRLHNFGLGAATRRTTLRLSGTASRTIEEGGSAEGAEHVEEVLVRAASEAIPELLEEERRRGGRGGIELLHVNCEGCEYDVIEGLRSADHLAGVAHVQIATHLLEHTGPAANFHEAMAYSLQVSVKRYCEMHETLSATHTRIWGLPWVWERWTRRDLL